MKRSPRTVHICLILVAALIICKSASSQQPSRLNGKQVETLIGETVKNMPADLATESARTALRASVLEFHVARSALALWGYEMKPEFQRAFAQGYGMFLTGLNRKDFSITIKRNDVQTMLKGYSKNADMFYKFLRTAKGQYNFLSLPDQEIIKQQIKFSALVYKIDNAQWVKLTSGWSIFVPISEGP